MRETRTRDIDGMTFQVQQLGGWAAQRLSIRLARIIAPSLARVAGAAGAGLKSLDLSQLGSAADMLSDKLPPEEYVEIFQLMLDGALISEGGGMIPLLKVFDLKLAGQPLTGFKLFKFCLEVNFESFSSALSALGDAMRAAVSKATSPSESSKSGLATGS